MAADFRECDGLTTERNERSRNQCMPSETGAALVRLGIVLTTCKNRVVVSSDSYARKEGWTVDRLHRSGRLADDDGSDGWFMLTASAKDDTSCSLMLSVHPLGRSRPSKRDA
jgi:hypothetical protein